MNIFQRVSNQEKILFARNLAVMTKAGMPILDSLRLMAKQSRSKAMIQALERICQDVSNGQTLASSLEQFKNIFDDFTINLIRIGEAGGILYENLNYLAQELKKRQNLRKKITGAMTYPAIVLTMAFGVIGIVIFYVFPKILPVLRGLKVQPPLTTRILMACSQFLLNYGLYVGLGLLLLVIVVWIFISKIRSFRYLLHRLILLTPLVKRISLNYNLTTFNRTLGLMLKSGIKVVEALRITSNTMSNLVYRKEIEAIAADVSEGEEISRRLSKRSYLFPTTLAQMVAVGEKTGNLSESLLYLADVYEDDLDDITKNLSTIIEPVLMVILGAIVAFIALSIITPIYSVTQHL